MPAKANGLENISRPKGFGTWTSCDAIRKRRSALPVGSAVSFATACRSIHCESNMTRRTQQATLGGGCFWCLEAVFAPLRGVESVVSGYAGGHVEHPTYEQVCSGRTGHAEVVQLTFDPAELSFREILEIFFTMHDPTTRDRQGGDVGPQYRSIILFHDEEQRTTAEGAIRELESGRVWDDPIVTEIVPLETFYPAETHHQDYYRNHALQPYCQVIIAPKVSKLRRKYADRIKQEAGT